MKIALVAFVSEISKEEKINSSLKNYYDILNDNFIIDEIVVDDIPFTDFSEYELTINFIKSGGSENLFKENLNYLPQPIYLLAAAFNNSLPAALEILSFLNSEGIDAQILHGEPEDLTAEIEELAAYKKVRDNIAEARLGVIGSPSAWLIGSEVNYEHAAHHWGTEFVDIKLESVYSRLEKVDSGKAKKIAADFLDKSAAVVGDNRADLVEAAEVYLALKEIVGEYDLDGFTIRCFDLVKKLETTGCLALSLLNNEGITAGCEGDVPALFTMFLVKKLTAKASFMANPAAIDKKKNEILFTHCTAATDLSEEYIIDSHFESGIGVGIQAKFKKGPVTVFKIGGAGLEQYFVAEGKIIDNPDLDNACRTQLKVSLPQSSDYFLNDSIGNHHIIIKGHHTAKINEFLGKE